MQQPADNHKSTLILDMSDPADVAVDAAEAAVGLAILVTFFRNRGDIAVDDASVMKG